MERVYPEGVCPERVSTEIVRTKRVSTERVRHTEKGALGECVLRE